MLTLEQIRKRVETMNIYRVAEKAGVHPNALYSLVNGKSDPKYSTVKKVSDYLEKLELS